MRSAIVSLKSLLLLALIASFIDADRRSGVEAKNVVKREDDDDSRSDTKLDAESANASEEKTKPTSGPDEDSESSKSEGESASKKSEQKSEEPAEDGSRSAASAASASASASASAAAAASASASASATASAVAEATAEASVPDLAISDAASLLASSSASSSASASAAATAAAVATSEESASRSGLSESTSTKRPAAKETTPKANEGDDDSEESDKEESEEGEQDAGESRHVAIPNFKAEASAGLKFDLFRNLISNQNAANKTVVLSMNAHLGGGSDSSGPGAKSTAAPALVLNQNGTKMISAGGTMKPIRDDKAKELVDKAKNDPKSYKIETFQSMREYDEVVKDKNSSKIRSEEFLINGHMTTPEPLATKKPDGSARPTSGPSTTSKPGGSAKPDPGPGTTRQPAPVTERPKISPAGNSTSAKPTLSSTTGKPLLSTTLRPTTAALTTMKPASTSLRPDVSTTAKPSNGSSSRPILVGSSTTSKPKSTTPISRATAAPTTVAPRQPVCPTCAPCSQKAGPTEKTSNCRPQVLADFQAGDKLLAIAVTNKGYFKGRRINAKAIETIMKGKLSATTAQIEGGITISPNNSFVFPAGHYYFPHPIRFAGFQSP